MSGVACCSIDQPGAGVPFLPPDIGGIAVTLPSLASSIPSRFTGEAVGRWTLGSRHDKALEEVGRFASTSCWMPRMPHREIDGYRVSRRLA